MKLSKISKFGDRGLSHCPICRSREWSKELRFCMECNRIIPKGKHKLHGLKEKAHKKPRALSPLEVQETLGSGRLPNFDEDELVASVCKESFYEFVREFWDTVIPEKPIWNWHIKYLCDELQKIAERVFKGLPKLYDLIINISPGTTKSTIASIMFPAWCWIRKPSSRIIGASYSYNLAMDLSRKCRDVVKSDKYQRCFPYVKIRVDQDSKGYFITTAGGDRFSAGVNGTVTGMHGHFIIVDDPLDPQQSLSDTEIQNANTWMGETLPSRKVEKRVAPMILIMQRLHQNDPTGSRLEKQHKNPVKHICLPAEESENIKPPELRKFYKKGLMDPVRLDRVALAAALSELKEYGFAGQYMQDPVPRGGAMFHVDKIQILKSYPKMRRIVRFWDKAGTLWGGAYTVGVKMGMDFEGNFWVLDVIRGQWDASRREKIILSTAILDGKGVLIGQEQEPGSGGKESAENTVRTLRGFSIRTVKVGKNEGDKIQRADAYSSQVNAGNVRLLEGAWNADYVGEMRFFPRSKYKDQIDASSGAFNLLARGPSVLGGLGLLKTVYA